MSQDTLRADAQGVLLAAYGGELSHDEQGFTEQQVMFWLVQERDRLMDAQARANAVIDVARRMASYRKRGGPRPLWNEFREELARYDAQHEDGDGIR